MRASVLAVVLFAGCAFGCGYTGGASSPPSELRTPAVLAPPEGAPPRARGGGPQSFEEIQRFSEAICSRERRCGNVGPAGRYASRTECIGAVSEEATHELVGCAGGLERRLMGCVQVLEDQPCEEASAPPECRLATLCSP